ncbi:MAG: oligopeptide transporter, OPT family [Candidatus Eisenbacteria bacterium]|nr:oligopeptide transporter, OPT family [Candidatus Eisenbacteria bacterium]
MSEHETPRPAQLPENAYRELKTGEKYVPILSAEKGVPEITKRSILFGLAMIVVFSAAAGYIALKLGQGIETAIPISILAVGYSAIMARKSGLVENVNILAIGATSGIVVGGSVFVMPAIYILGLEGNFFRIFIAPFLGAVLGALFLIPFRRYFTTEMHGKLPFPEATATTEILVTGERGGSAAKVLLYALGIGIVLDYLALAFHTWSERFTTAAIPALDTLTNRLKAVFSMNTSAAVLGLGYIIGIRYASIIMSGSMLAFFVLIPLFGYLSPRHGGLSYNEIFFGAEGGAIPGVRNIGIGGIFAAGIISIIKMSPVIRQALRQMIGQLFTKHEGAVETSRLEKDMKMTTVVGLMLLLAVIIFGYFRFVVLAGEPGATALSLISTLLVYLIVFLFSAVSAWAIAMISVTPISGMTLTTLIIAAVSLSALGLKGQAGMLAILLIGGVVCTALSMSGSLVTQFKIGQWLGSTPRSIQWSNIIGSAVAAAIVTAIIMLFAHVYGYGAPSAENPRPLAAPQATAMAAVIDAFLGGQGAPWPLYGIGAAIACIVTVLGISPLAFALGMYLPIELNSPILFGAIVAWLVQKSAKDGALSKARNDKGILLASGLIAGGALAGVFDALTKMLEEAAGGALPKLGLPAGVSNWFGFVVFFGLATLLYLDAKRAKAE